MTPPFQSTAVMDPIEPVTSRLRPKMLAAEKQGGRPTERADGGGVGES